VNRENLAYERDLPVPGVRAKAHSASDAMMEVAVLINQGKSASITVLGIDLAKRVFYLHETGQSGKLELVRTRAGRDLLL